MFTVEMGPLQATDYSRMHKL